MQRLCEKTAFKRYFRLALLHFLHFLQNLHHLPSILRFLPNFSYLFCWHFRTSFRAFRTSFRAFCAFCRAFYTFYRAFTPFTELSRSLLNLHPYRIFLVCTALHVYPCIPRRALCFLCALFVPFFLCYLYPSPRYLRYFSYYYCLLFCFLPLCFAFFTYLHTQAYRQNR